MNKGKNKDYETMELMFREPQKKIDEIISREIWTMNEDNLEEDYPVSFNMDEFKSLTSFAARKRYADEHLEKIASGSGRHVYGVDDKKALKLAANQKGLEQNAEESSVSDQGWNDDVITKVIDSHPKNLWIESERAKKVGKNRFKELTGYRVEDVGAFLKLYDHKANGRGQYYGAELDKTIEEDMWENEFTSSLGEMIANFAQSAGDLDRISSYGEVNRDGQPQIVVIDYGLSHDVYNTYYDKSRRREGIENEEDIINEVQFQMQDYLDNAAEDANIKDGGYGGNAFTSSNELVGDDLNEYAYEDYRDISSENLKQSTDFIEAHGDVYRPTGEMVSKLLKNYLIGSQNIENALKISNNNVKFFNNLMKIQKFFKGIGLIKEDLVYWGIDGNVDSESDEYKLGAQGINEDGTSLYTNAQGTVNAEDTDWGIDEMMSEVKNDIITERIMSWMPKSKAVTVKKKCKLGGNGDGTSTACNQGDISNLNIEEINDNNQHRREANIINVAEDEKWFDKKINEVVDELMNESIISRNEKDEIFNYSSVIDDAWSDPIKQGKEFYKINFDLENNDSTKQKKTFFFNKNLRKDQPIKYEINAELWKASGDWEYSVMYFKVEISSDYGLKLSDEEKEAKKEPEFPWDIKGNLAWNHKYVMIPPIESGNKYTEGESDSGKYKYFAWQDESINDAGIDEKDIKITDVDEKSAWKWLEETFEKAVDDRHKMLDESIFLIKNIINEEIISKQRLKEIAEDHNINTVLKAAQIDSGSSLYENNINEENNECEKLEIPDYISNYLKKFKSDEDLLRSGGLPDDLLDQWAFGFTQEKNTIMPNELKVRWRNDLENVKWEIEQKRLSDIEYAQSVDLSEPIEVDYDKPNGWSEAFYIQDGHHRYYAAKILNKPLNMNLTIKVNPTLKLSNMDYDKFHRCIWEQTKGLNEGETINKTLTVYHGTKSKFLNNIKQNGLITKNGYNQGWYMVSTDFESALFHAHPDEENGEVYVVEFNIPLNENEKWEGYPFLWKGQIMNDRSTWYALMKQLPTDFIKEIHKIDNGDWMKQKNNGFNSVTQESNSTYKKFK